VKLEVMNGMMPLIAMYWIESESYWIR